MNAERQNERRPATAAPLGLSVFWAYLLGAALVAIPIFFLVPDPIGILANLRVVDELADMGLVRDMDVGTGFIDGVPQVIHHSKRPLAWNLITLSFVSIVIAYLTRGIRQRLLANHLGIPSSVSSQISSYFFGRGLNVVFPFGPGELGTTQQLVRNGADPERSTATVFYTRVFELSGVVVFLVIGLGLSGWGGSLVPFLLSAVVVAGLTWTTRPMGRGTDGGRSFAGALWDAVNGKRIVQAMREMSSAPSSSLGLVGLSAAALGFELAGLYLLKQGFSTREFLLLKDLPLSGLVMAIAVASLARIVPFTPGGMGFYELSMVAVFLAYGEDVTAGTTVAVLDGLVELQRLIQNEGPKGLTGINPRQTKDELLLSRS